MFKNAQNAAWLMAGAFLVSAFAAGPPRMESLQPMSQAMFRSDRYEYEYKSGAVRLQDVWLVVGVRARGELGGPQQYQLWKVDAQGKKLREIDLGTTAPLNRSQTGEVRVHDLTGLKSGNLALLIEGNQEAALLLLEGETGQVMATRKVTAIPSGSFINKVLPALDGGMIALGRSGSRGFLLKLRSSGEPDAQAVLDDKDLMVLTDGLELPDHTLMLVGEHIDDTGKVSVWVGRVTAKGDILSKATFAGQGAAISCHGGSPGCAVIYSTRGADGWNISVRSFAENLTLAWQADLLSGIRLVPGLRAIVQADGGLFVAAGNANNRLWTAWLSKGGKIVSSSTFEEPAVQWQRLWNFDVLATPQEFVLPFTELLVGEDKEQRQVLKILRLQKL